MKVLENSLDKENQNQIEPIETTDSLKKLIIMMKKKIFLA